MAEENKEEKVDSFIERYHQGFDTLREFGCDPNRQRLHIKIPNARELLWAGLRYYLGDRAVWLPAYDEVAAWLTDNQRRGLLCIGGNGLGKSIICQRIIPALILKRVDYVVSCYTAVEMTQQLDILLRLPLLSIDDIGTEPLETVNYGVRRIAFSEIVDRSEKQGTLLVLSTNLRTNHATGRDGQPIPSIEDRYGLRTYDRLRAVVKAVVFRGDSLRY